MYDRFDLGENNKVSITLRSCLMDWHNMAIIMAMLYLGLILLLGLNENYRVQEMHSGHNVVN
jgi:hypothetical protein